MTQWREGRLTVDHLASLRRYVVASHSTVTDFARFLG
jgi:hypothetical protein